MLEWIISHHNGVSVAPFAVTCAPSEQITAFHLRPGPFHRPEPQPRPQPEPQRDWPGKTWSPPPSQHPPDALPSVGPHGADDPPDDPPDNDD